MKTLILTLTAGFSVYLAFNFSDFCLFFEPMRPYTPSPLYQASVSQSSGSPSPSVSSQAPAKQPAMEKSTGSEMGLPAQNCLTDRFGIQLKVITTRADVRCTERPGGQMVGQPLLFFRPYFVFQKEPATGPTPRFYRIGTSPQVNSILGWVAADAVSVWSTRVGARCVPTGGTVRYLDVYKEKDDLVTVLQENRTDRLPLARTPIVPSNALNPWPIVEHADLPVNGFPTPIVKLNFLGVAQPAGTGQPASGVPAGPVYSDTEVEEITRQIRSLDLVFVVDCTGSMQPFLDATRQAVTQISTRIRSLNPRPDLALGLVAYRDWDRESGFAAMYWDLEKDPEKFLYLISNLCAAEGGDVPEAVYEGLFAAITKTSWRGGGLSDRIIVLVGDCPAHEPGEVGSQGYSRNQVVELAAQKNIRIFSLAVGGYEELPTRQQRWAQFADLARRRGGSIYPVEQEAQLVQTIQGILAQRSEVIQKRNVVVQSLRAGKLRTQVAADEQMEIGEVTEIVQFLENGGIDPGRLASSASSNTPVFGEGWAPMEKDGNQLLKRQVFLCRAELDYLLSTLHMLNSSLAPGTASRLFSVGISSRIFPTADLLEDDLPQDVWLQAQGIPTGPSSILRLSKSEIAHMSEQRRAELRDRISREIIPALVNARNDNSRWFQRGDLEWGWVDESLLP